MSGNLMITIGRQTGSGGREIGEKVAGLLEIAYYDRELITLASKKSGISQEILSNVDEKATNSLLYSLALGTSVSGWHNSSYMDIPLSDKLFMVQSDVIKSIAAEHSAVIVGRCADYVLENEAPLVRLFIYAPLKYRAERTAKKNELTFEKAEDLLVKTDKRRSNYYSYYTNRKWGNPSSYDLMIDSSKLGPDETAAFIAEYYNIVKKRIG